MEYNFRFADEVQQRNDNAIAYGEESITHPINAFLLIKEMTTDWRKVVDIMMSNSADEFIRNVTHQRIMRRFRYPTEVCHLLNYSDYLLIGKFLLVSGTITKNCFKGFLLFSMHRCF